MEVMSLNRSVIELVRKRPCLYNPQSPFFNDKERRYCAWKEISNATKHPIKFCITRWTSLRDRFVKEKKKEERARKNNYSKEALSQWEFYEAMSFIKDYVKHRNRTTITFLRPSPNSSLTLHDDDDEKHSNATPSAEEDCVSDYAVEIRSEENPPKKETDAYSVQSDEGSNTTNDATTSDLYSATPSDACAIFENDVGSSSYQPAPKRFKRVYERKEKQLHLKESIVTLIRENNQMIRKSLSSNRREGNDQYEAFGHLVACKLKAMEPNKADEIMGVISNCLFGRFELQDQ